MGFSAGVYWLDSTSSHTSTIADSLRSPSFNSSGLFLRHTYLQIARDSNKKKLDRAIREGRWARTFLARWSGALCSPLEKSSGTISYSAPASSSTATHLVTFHDSVDPYSFIGAIALPS
ncbi:Os01g0764050, partial [Oryza sativa Japonica Group]